MKAKKLASLEEEDMYIQAEQNSNAWVWSDNTNMNN
jgi:hypothetical protein